MKLILISQGEETSPDLEERTLADLWFKVRIKQNGNMMKLILGIFQEPQLVLSVVTGNVKPDLPPFSGRDNIPLVMFFQQAGPRSWRSSSTMWASHLLWTHSTGYFTWTLTLRIPLFRLFSSRHLDHLVDLGPGACGGEWPQHGEEEESEGASGSKHLGQRRRRGHLDHNVECYTGSLNFSLVWS